MICLLTLIPARLIVPGMPDVGRPALIVCLLMFAWWVLVRFTSNQLVLMGRQPLRWAMWFFVVTMLLSYVVGQLRGLTTAEANGADNALLWLATFAGVALMTADGISNWSRLNVVVVVLVVCGAIMAGIALVQYVFSFDITSYINIPGLVPKRDLKGFEVRGDGIRVASTTIHYIELSATLATILPFAIHLSLYSATVKRRIVFGVAAVLCVLGVATTISRTGILALAVVLVVLIPVWGWRRRFNFFVLAMGLIAGLAAAQPGLVRTLYRLFDDPSDNPAFTVRQARYPAVWAYVSQRPWLGRGTGTYVYPPYEVLDNQWLESLIMNGIVGVIAIAALHLTAIVMAGLAMRRAQTPQVRHLCAAAMSTQLIAPLVAGTFDTFAFLTYITVVGLTLGICGVVWRLTHPARLVRTSTTRWFTGT
jgi:O-antigen ligase